MSANGHMEPRPGEVRLKEYAMGVAERLGVAYRQALDGIRVGRRGYPQPPIRSVNGRVKFVLVGGKGKL